MLLYVTFTCWTCTNAQHTESFTTFSATVRHIIDNPGHSVDASIEEPYED